MVLIPLKIDGAAEQRLHDLQSEINRISTDTTFNNIAVLSVAASTGITFQIGADNTQSMTVSIPNHNTVSAAGLNISTAYCS